MTLFLLLLALLFGLSAAYMNFTTVFEWNTFDFVWPSEDFGKEALRKGDYVPTKFFPEDHVVYGERVFISIYKSSKHPTPVTLTWLRSTSTSRSPKLNPYPSWRMHEKGNCMTMQEIRGMVVDARGRLWAVDNGNEICPAKLWIFDLTENDSLILVHQFTNDTVAHTFRNRDLNSLVLDKRPNDTLAYIPDYVSGNMIVFSMDENASWAIQIKDVSDISCIALSPIKRKELIYLGSSINTGLYSVPLSELRTRGQQTPLTPTLVGNKKSGSFKMLMDNKGKLYFDLTNLSYVGIWDTTAPFKEEELYKDEQLKYYYFKFSFAFDTCNNLWTLTRDINKTTNFRLLRAAVEARSYLYNDLKPSKGCGRISFDCPTKIYEDSIFSNFSTNFNVAFLACLAVSCCIILWLGLWVKRLKKTINRMKKETQEMAVLPSEPTATHYGIQREQLDEEMYDDVAPPVASTSVQIELGSASNVYEEVNPSPPGSELYLKLVNR